MKFVRSLGQQDSSSEQQQALKYLGLINSQVQLMQSYVSDLLDLRQMKDGVFTLVREVFDPTDVLNLVCSIFNP